MKNKWIIGGVLIVSFLAAGYLFLGLDIGGKGEKAALGELEKPVTADDRVSAEGVVLPLNHAACSFLTSGKAVEVLVKEGDEVKQGQVLARLDNQDLKVQVAKAQAEFSRVKASKESMLVYAQNDYDNAKADFDRTQELFQQGAIAQQQLESAQAVLVKAEAALAEARLNNQGDVSGAEAEIALAKAVLQQAQIALSRSELTAPFDGTIASINIKTGEFVESGNPVIWLADLNNLEIKTDDLTELDIARIREGDTATISFDAVPDLELPGKVNRIKAYGEEKNGDITYTVTITPERSDPRLRWNMTAYVLIDAAKN